MEQLLSLRLISIGDSTHTKEDFPSDGAPIIGVDPSGDLLKGGGRILEGYS